MKKLIAVLMAMLMVFSCVPALGEETGISINVPSFTLTSEVTIDEEQVMALLPALGMPEETVGMVQTFLPMLNGLKETLIFADMGLQYDLQMKGQNILSVVGEANETGLALSTNLVPSYKLTIQAETIQKLVNQLTEQLQGNASQLDMELIQQAAEKLSGYVMELVPVFQSVITFGEPVKGEYADLIEGVVFNTEMSMTVDVKGMADALQQFVPGTCIDLGHAVDDLFQFVPGVAKLWNSVLAYFDLDIHQTFNIFCRLFRFFLYHLLKGLAGNIFHGKSPASVCRSHGNDSGNLYACFFNAGMNIGFIKYICLRMGRSKFFNDHISFPVYGFIGFLLDNLSVCHRSSP